MLSTARLEQFEKALTKLRKRILREIDFEEQTIRVHPRDAAGSGAAYGAYMMAEQATDAEAREVAAFLAGTESETLTDINDALRKIYANKDYGFCEDCGTQISVRRLKALPYAKRCKKCQLRRELVKSSP